MSSSTSSLEARHRQLGLTDEEYDRILERLGRTPRDVELAMLSLMWSEHCGYKHSRRLLRRLPKEGRHVLLGPGENAGAVDVGGGLAVAFKVESHNHPSAVEPFQGAATGVGGILRDVFAVGARPIAVLDSLRFGEPTSRRSRYLLDQAAAGPGNVVVLLGRSPDETGSAAPQSWPAPSWARETKPSDRRSRSVTRSQ